MEQKYAIRPAWNSKAANLNLNINCIIIIPPRRLPG